MTVATLFMMLESVAIAAARMPAMMRPLIPIGSSAAMKSGKVASIDSSGFMRSGWLL